MGNTNQGERFKGDDGINELGISTLHNWPILFHATHSTNVRLSHDRRRAKRVDGIKGVCFSSRPVCIGERIYVRITDASNVKNGALRFGFTTDNPCTIDESDLPRYAFPDLTNEQGYWAKAVPEAMAQRGIVLFFVINVGSTEVHYGINDVEVGVFFSGVQTSSPLWALLDLYGSTVAVEFVDGEQVTPAGSYISVVGDPVLHQDHPGAPYYVHPAVCPAHSQPSPTLSLSTLPSHPASSSVPGGIHPHVDIIDPMPFHHVHGRSVMLSLDRMVARRAPDEYCNGYVFTCRALHLGERLVTSVTAVERDYVGGLAFGMTSCDPSCLHVTNLPDDADLLLDRPEYWVVHKDVCAKPDVGDELSFSLTSSGEVWYARNGHHVTTLMHVDTSLPLWAFLDIYGSTKEIKSIGVVITPLVIHASQGNTRCHHSAVPAVTNNVASLRLSEFHSETQLSADMRSSLSRPHHHHHHHRHHHHNAVSSSSSVDNSPASEAQLNSQVVIHPAYCHQPPLKRLHSSSEILPSASTKVTSIDAPLEQLSLPPPLIPVPSNQSVTQTKHTSAGTQPRTQTRTPRQTLPSTPPPVPLRRSVGNIRETTSSALPTVVRPNDTTAVDEMTRSGDAPSNECVVCLERPPDSVLYTCGHMCMCFSCARDVVHSRGALCPICRQSIRDVIKIFRT